MAESEREEREGKLGGWFLIVLGVCVILVAVCMVRATRALGRIADAMEQRCR